MRARRRLLAAIALSIAGASCAPSYADDVRAICSAPALSGGAGRLDDAERLATSERWMATHARSAEGKALVAKLTMVDVDPASLMRAEARRVGVEECPLASEYEAGLRRQARLRDAQTLCGYRLEELDASSLRSEEGRALRASLQNAAPSDRARLLRAEAHAVGLAGCSMADATAPPEKKE